MTLLAIVTVRTSFAAGLCTYAASGEISPSDPKAGIRLVVILQNPPRTRVTLSIDSTQGAHYELAWDPVANEGLQHEVLLPPSDKWTLTASSSFERIVAESNVVTFFTQFTTYSATSSGIQITGDNFVQVAPNKPESAKSGSPILNASCSPAQKDLAKLVLNKRRVTAVSKTRGLLDQAIPAPLESALSILADIAVERAKSGAMSLIKEKFVRPVCDQLTFELFAIAGSSGRILPRTCTLVEHMQLQDVLSSGRALVSSVSDDIRQTFLPALIASLPQLNDQMQTLALLSLKLASSAVDGQMDGIVEIDYLVTLLDQLSWATGFDRDITLVSRWVKESVGPDLQLNTVKNKINDELGRPDVPDAPWKTLGACQAVAPTNRPNLDSCAREVTRSSSKPIVAWRTAVRDIRADIVELALPETFDAPGSIDTKPWRFLPACKPSDIGASMTGALTYTRANRDKCVHAIVASLPASEWIEVGVANRYFTIDQVIAAARASSKSNFADWLQKTWNHDIRIRGGSDAAERAKATKKYLQEELIDKLEGPQRAALDAACGFRLVVGIAKWCSSQDACAAGDVAAILNDPSRVFTPSNELPWALCWNENVYRTPPRLDRYIDLGVRLVAFLNPPVKGDERRRILAMISWMFDVVTEIAPDQTSVTRLHDVIKHVINREYMVALSDSISLAATFRSRSDFPKAAVRALQLLGAVGSYAHTYEETKSIDATAARNARRQAIEALIDAATDRHGRGREVVWTVGSNVGVSWSYLDEFQRDYFKPGDGEIGVRVPLGLAVQYLPLGSAKDPDLKKDARYIGLMAGLQLGDLGQFARTSDAPVTWKGFIAPGIEAGFLFGEPHRTITLTANVSYSPEISDGAPPTWRYGFAVGYYVPFLDLN